MRIVPNCCRSMSISLLGLFANVGTNVDSIDDDVNTFVEGDISCLSGGASNTAAFAYW